MSKRVQIVLCTVLTLAVAMPLWAASSRPPVEDETMLMFVGEALGVVTVASRRPESPAAAPAVATTVERRDIEAHGYQTLADALAMEPGFFIAPRAEGSVPYLRGIPNGVLFLYDGVPITSEVSKDIEPLDRQLSLANVKRVEIVRGPGSVLWGPDAFAGVVNVVPLTGRDRPGLETRAFAGSENYHGGYASWGGAGEKWDVFLSGNVAKEGFYDDVYRLGTFPGGNGKVDPSQYVELTGNAHVGHWLSLSGRLSDFQRRFTLADAAGDTWAGERQSPVSFLKASITQTIGFSHISFTGYYQKVRYQITDVDLAWKQENDLYSGELLWDCRVGEKGLFTAGLSSRDNVVSGAVVEGGFLPEFLQPSNQIFMPSVQQADYSDRLNSIFGQYRHRFQNIDWWIGARYDSHTQYRSTTSYSLGFNWPVAPFWRIKTAVGSAYRSPYSGQLFGVDTVDPEQISTANFQVSWTPSEAQDYSVTTFYSQLSNHLNEDPYGGLSVPSDQSLTGVELTARLRFNDSLSVSAGFTALNAWGDKEQYRAFQFAFVRPDGTRVEFFDTWTQPFDTGPRWIVSSGVQWRFHPRATLAVDACLADRFDYSYDKGTLSGSYHQPLLINANLRVAKFLLPHMDLSIKVKNLLDQYYTVPDRYGPVKGVPLTLYGELSWRF